VTLSKQEYKNLLLDLSNATTWQTVTIDRNRLFLGLEPLGPEPHGGSTGSPLQGPSLPEAPVPEPKSVPFSCTITGSCPRAIMEPLLGNLIAMMSDARWSVDTVSVQFMQSATFSPTPSLASGL
jgi:hypothetical protein